MKSFKLLGAGLLALGAINMAHAVTVIRITGSTAFRLATNTTITKILDPGYTYGGVGGAGLGTSQMIFSGTLASTHAPVLIKTAYVGSEGGLYSLTHPSTPPTNTKYIVDSPSVALTTTGATIPSSDASDITGADVAMSDTFQSSSVWTSPTLNDHQVGVVTFAWVGANGNDAPITNITHQQVKAVLGNVGTLNLWSGDFANDGAISVKMVGRDEDSGTRVTAFQESTFGSAGSPTQYQPDGSGGLNPWPAATVNTVSYGAGHSGYASGGTLAGILRTVGVNNSADVISYLSKADTNTLISTTGVSGTVQPGTVLSWEGVAYYHGGAFDDSLVYNGAYTFWGYEHLYTKTNAGDVGQFATDATSYLTSSTAANVAVAELSGASLTKMKVKRSVDGGPVFNK